MITKEKLKQEYKTCEEIISKLPIRMRDCPYEEDLQVMEDFLYSAIKDLADWARAKIHAHEQWQEYVNRF